MLKALSGAFAVSVLVVAGCTPPAEQQQQELVDSGSVFSPDGGFVFVVPDSGVGDGGADSGVPDSGTPDAGPVETDGGPLTPDAGDDAGVKPGDGGCMPENAAQLCAALDACGSEQAVDRCGNTRTLDCGDCSGKGTCDTNTCLCDDGYTDIAGQCVGCTAATDAQLCALNEDQCGTATVDDGCGDERSVDCGSCGSNGTCDPVENVCQCAQGYSYDGTTCATCTAEDDATLCASAEDNCGTPTLTDNCGFMRTVNCGTCGAQAMCSTSFYCQCATGYSMQNGVCVLCTAESDSDLCLEEEDICGQPTVVDSCGNTRTPNCGSCGVHASCADTYDYCMCDPGYNDVNEDGSECTPGIGHPCAVGDGTQQDCPTGQACLPMPYSPGINVCNIQCQFDEDCGTNGDAFNGCDTRSGLCVLGCDDVVANTCLSSALSCYPDSEVCATDCATAPADYCSATLYNGSCVQSSGLCQWQECSDTTDCPTGQVCYMDEIVPYTPLQYCVPDCTLPANSGVCTNGFACDPSNGTCDLSPDAGSTVDGGTDTDGGIDLDAAVDIDAGPDLDAAVDIDAGSDSDAGVDIDGGSPDSGGGG